MLINRSLFGARPPWANPLRRHPKEIVVLVEPGPAPRVPPRGQRYGDRLARLTKSIDELRYLRDEVPCSPAWRALLREADQTLDDTFQGWKSGEVDDEAFNLVFSLWRAVALRDEDRIRKAKARLNAATAR